MLLLIRKQVLMDDNVKGPIADNDLAFDAFVKTPQKMYRVGISDLNSEAKIIEKTDDEEMHAIRVQGFEATIQNEFFTTTALTDVEKQDPNILNEIQTLIFGIPANSDPEQHFTAITT